MAQVTVRNIPDEVHRALRARAVKHGRSTEAEIRAILADAVDSSDRAQLGDLLWRIGREARLDDDDVAVFDVVRDRSAAEPIDLG